MSSTIENNKIKNRNQRQRSNSGSTLSTPRATTNPTQTLKKGQDNDNNTNEEEEEEEEEAKRTKRRPTKVGLNDTLRLIRNLIVEGRSNTEIQAILQLEERTFYRYMAKIYEIDKALFAEQEKKILITEFGICKDRLLKSYRWLIALADNENIKADTRLAAQNCALQVTVAVLKTEMLGPRNIRKEGSVDKILANSSDY